MEQWVRQSDTLELTSETQKRDFQSRQRALFFSVLGKIKEAGIELKEPHQSHFFGERSAELQAHLTIHDSGFYKDIIHGGSIGAAEAFIEKKWSSPDLTSLIQVMARNQQQLDKLESKMHWLKKLKATLFHRANVNNEQGSKRNILAHYDLGNQLYSRFLDPAMQYSSAIYSEQASTLEQAQQLKMKSICEQLELSAGDQVIEIGTGWGGLAIYMAKHYGCHVTTTTISDAQHQYAQEKIKQLDLSNQITLLKRDYRQLRGKFDKLVSIEMIEAVGHEFLPTYLSKCSELLKPNGTMLLQSITIADGRYEQYRKSVDFIQKYIFPGGCLPSIATITKQLAQNTDMVVHQMQDIGLHYARTLYDWRLRFEQSWPELAGAGYDEKFKRLWLFYLCYCEGAFLQRVISTHHIVARKPRYRGQCDETVLDY